MARHIMAVCVVCLICAEHLPCKGHLITENHLKSVRNHFSSNVIDTYDRLARNVWKTPSDERVTDPDFQIKSIYEKQKQKSKRDQHKLEKQSERKRRQLATYNDHGHDHDHINCKDPDHAHGHNHKDHTHEETEVRIRRQLAPQKDHEHDHDHKNCNNPNHAHGHNHKDHTNQEPKVRMKRQLAPHNDHGHDHDHSHEDHEDHVPTVRTEKSTTVSKDHGHGYGHDHKTEQRLEKPSNDHDHDHHESEVRPNTNTFLKEIFKQFGDADGMQMNVTGFEKMLTGLGLFELVTARLDVGKTPSIASVGEESPNNSCINSIHLMTVVPGGDQLKRPKITRLLEQYKDDARASTTAPGAAAVGNATNLKKDVILKAIKENVMIDTKDLWTMCPLLLYQLVAPTSRERNGCIQNNLLPMKFDKSTFLDHLISASEKEKEAEYGMMEDRSSVWLYASLSTLGVSLCGLLGVAVIPCMDTHFYQHIIQFLVALAVGTLVGDALLHLLPHAMMTVDVGHDPHLSMTLKGLAAVFGIVFFYFMERFLNVTTEWWQKRQKKDKVNSRVRVIRDPESASLNGVGMNGVGANAHPQDKYTCKHKYSSYPYCYDEIAMETKDDHHEHHKAEPNTDGDFGAIVSKMNHNSHSHNHNHGEHGDHLLLPEPDLTKESPVDEELLNNHDTNTISTNCDGGSIERKDKEERTKKPMAEESYTIILREHESKHHGHSHTHGHVHSPPGSLSAVVWMVIMGDGLHNFTDGMAIGAAFSNNIAGGFSTAIAVFCHELPHELGDFAVLLKAGMTAKQAVYYNLLSSVLSFFGMVLGVWVGDTPAASAWIFAAAAGMFLYIALVDMLPELTSSHGKEERCIKSQFVLQFLGMAAGVGTMLLIAIFEHDLKEIFSSGNTGHHHHHHH